jgi:hypothetical protein
VLSDVSRHYVDLSTKIINAKLDNFLRGMDNLEQLPEPKSISHYLNEIVDNEDDPTNLLFSLMKHIKNAACSFRKKMKNTLPNRISDLNK